VSTGCGARGTASVLTVGVLSRGREDEVSVGIPNLFAKVAIVSLRR
jgi:hypothetical protein